MRRYAVRDVMTQDVHTARLDTRFHEIVRIMEEHKVSALPVIDDRRHPVGVVSEADLLPKEGHQDQQVASRARPWFGRARAEHAKARAETAGELMSTPVIAVRPEATVHEAVRIMQRHRVKRLPVVDADGLLVGIVSRADLLRVFLRPDDEIRKEVIDEVLIRLLWTDPKDVTVEVHEGVVTLSGRVEQKSLIPLAVRLTASVEGVAEVIDRLSFDVDDTARATWRFPRA